MDESSERANETNEGKKRKKKENKKSLCQRLRRDLHGGGLFAWALCLGSSDVHQQAKRHRQIASPTD